MAKMIMVTPDNEPVDIDDKDFDSAIKNGLVPAMEYADKEGNISVVKKPDQKAAEAAGMVPRIIYEGKQDLSKFDDAKAPGKTESFARGLANAGTFGFSDEIGGASNALKRALQKGTLSDLKSDYQVGRDTYRAADDKAYAENKLLYGAGAAVPTLASLGAALPAQGVKQAAITGAKFGAAGALGGGTDFGKQADLTEGEFGKYAKDVAIGTALGGALGGGVQKGIQTLQGAPESLAKFAANRATKAAGGDSAKATRVVDRMPGGTESFGRDLLDSGIVSAGKSRKEIAAAADKVQQDSGKRIGEILGQFDTIAKEKNYTPGALQRIIDRSKKEVLDPLMSSPASQDLGERLNSKYLSKLESFAKDKGGSLSFKELAKERSGLDKLAFSETGLDKPLNDKLQALRRIFKEETLKDAAEIAPKELLDDYARQNRMFGVANTAKKLTEEQLARGQKNRSVSLTDYITGGATGAAGAAALGPIGLIGAPIAAGLNKVARERGNQLLAGGANALSKGLKGTPQALKDIAGKVRSDFADEAGFIGKRPQISNYRGVDVNSTLNKADVDSMFQKSQEIFKKPFNELSQAEKQQVLNSLAPRDASYSRNQLSVGAEGSPETLARVSDAAERIFKKPFGELSPQQKQTVIEKINDGSMGQRPDMEAIKENLRQGFANTSQSRMADELMSYSRKPKR